MKILTLQTIRALMNLNHTSGSPIKIITNNILIRSQLKKVKTRLIYKLDKQKCHLDRLLKNKNNKIIEITKMAYLKMKKDLMLKMIYILRIYR